MYAMRTSPRNLSFGFITLTFCSWLLCFCPLFGRVAEWPNASDSKSDVPQGTGGSNPSSSERSEEEKRKRGREAKASSFRVRDSKALGHFPWPPSIGRPAKGSVSSSSERSEEESEPMIWLAWGIRKLSPPRWTSSTLGHLPLEALHQEAFQGRCPPRKGESLSNRF